MYCIESKIKEAEPKYYENVYYCNITYNYNLSDKNWSNSCINFIRKVKTIF